MAEKDGKTKNKVAIMKKFIWDIYVKVYVLIKYYKQIL